MVSPFTEGEGDQLPESAFDAIGKLSALRHRQSGLRARLWIE
jgi:hypothetical protein